jgi:hypothetical protein
MDLQTVIDNADKTKEGSETSSYQEPSMDTMRCPPTSSLILDGEQEGELITFCVERVEDLKKQNSKRIEEQFNYINEHENHFKHREMAGTIFEKSNSSFNQSRRNAIPIIARLTRDFLGTEPFFACKPVRFEGSSVEADKVQNFANYKMKDAKLREALEDAIEMAAVTGERVVKITFDRDINYYKEKANVMVDDEGVEIRTSTGDVIYATDEWVDSSYFQQPDPTPDDKNQPGQPPAAQPPSKSKGFSISGLWQWGRPKPPVPIVIPPTGIQVLKKDPSVVQPATPNYKMMLVDQQEVLFSGPCAEGINHGDFLCGLNERDIQRAPYIAHVYELTVPEIVQKYVMSIDAESLDEAEMVFYKKLLQNIELLKGSDTTHKSEVKRPEVQNNEQQAGAGNDKYNGTVKLAEVYLRADPDEDGFQKEICVVIAVQHKFALFYDYTPNLVPKKMGRPFRIVRVTPKRNRWHGISEYKLNQHKQNFIDWCLNRSVYADAISGKFHFISPEMIEGADEQEVTPGDKWYKLKGQNPDATKAVQIVSSPPLEQATIDLMKDMMQSSQAERGNLAPGGDNISQLPSSRLKYGIEAIQRSGDEIYALSAINVERGLESVTEAMIITMLANMDPVEEFEYTQGDQYLSSHITASDIQQFKMNVSMDMTLTRGDQINEQAAQATDIVLSYLDLPAFKQVKVRPFILARLKSMDIQDSDESLPTPSDQDVDLSYKAFIAAQEQQAAPPIQPPGSKPTPKPPPPAPPEPGAPPPGPKLI